MNVIISPNLNKQRDFLDKKTGNVVDRKTGQVIEEVQAFTPPEIKATEVQKEYSLKEIKQMIENTQTRLNELEEMKAKKVAELKAELENE